MNNKNNKLGLYIHIPFCAKKCNYCDFLSGPYNDEIKKSYLDAIITEIKSYKYRAEEYQISTIFIGGGTPSSVEENYITSILETIYEVFNIEDKWNNPITEDNESIPYSIRGNSLQPEISIELNPGSIDEVKLSAYKKVGINRLSIGLQSANNKDLQLLGRIHSYEQFEDNYNLARSLGFKNINIDLISGIPLQTVKTWEYTLEKIANLKPEHISAYSLIIEEGTSFFEYYSEKGPYKHELPDEEIDRQIYKITKEILNSYGYKRYEISNYSKEGYKCKHNISYWTGVQYLGLGLGASSLIENTRFSNTTDINEYIKLCKAYSNVNKIDVLTKDIKYSMTKDIIGLRRNIEILTTQNQMEEFMFLGLRLIEGISNKEFYNRFNLDIDEVYGKAVKKLIQQDLLINNGNNLMLTERGIDISNIVLAEFLLN